MKESVDHVVVIGRGIAGLAVALELLRGGRRVTVLAPEIDETMGTRAAAGMSSIKGAITASKPLFALKKHGYEGLRKWVAEVERDAEERIPQLWTGSSEVFFDLMEYEGIRHRVFHRKFTGAFRIECLAGEGLRQIGGGLGVSCGKAIGGFYYAGDGWVDARKLLLVLESAIRKCGGVFLNARVTHVVDNAESGVVVHYDGRALTATEVILAAGQATGAILDRSVQYDAASALRQEPFAGETLFGDAPSNEPDYLVQYKKTTLAVVGGGVTFGSTCYLWPESAVDRQASQARALEALSPKHSKLGWQESKLTRSIWGVRGRTSDRLPLFGPLFLPSRNRRIWLVSGLYKSGLQLSHLFAGELRRILCETQGGGTLSPLFVPFRPDRLT